MTTQSPEACTVTDACRRAAAGFGNVPGYLMWLALLLPTVSVAPCATRPTFIQERDQQVTSGKAASVTFNSPPSAGNLLVVYLIWDNAGIASVSDSLGNIYASAVGATRWSNGRYSAQIFYTINRSSGADTVGVTFGTTIKSFGIIYAHEYTGVLQAAPIDVTAAAAGTSGSLNSGAATTSNDTDLLFAGGVSATSVTSPGTGYTARATSHGNMSEDRIVSAAGSYSATASNRSGAWAMQMVAFKGAASGTVDTTPPTVPTGLSPAVLSSSQITLSWTASTDPDDAPSQITYGVYRNGIRIGTTAAGVTSWADTGLAASTTYSYTVGASDVAGNNSAQTAPVSATTTAATQAPTVSITSPANNQNVSGITTIAANAADNVGVTGVQFKLDGANLGAEVTTSPYFSSWDTSQSTNASHLLTAAARDAAGNVTVSSGVTVTVSNGSLTPYSTNFTGTENPLSESGEWINGGTTGLDWHDCRKTPGLAFGTQPATVNYDDSTCVLTGSWGPDQTAQATVRVVSSDTTQFEEVEVRLHTTISAHSITGYEINCSVKPGNPYMQIVRWNGVLGSFTMLNGTGVGCVNGDVLKGANVGGVITAYKNGVAMFSVTDSTYTGGAPGMGFYIQGGSSSTNSDFGFSSFSASDGLRSDTTPPSTPGNLSAVAVSSSQINLSWTAATDNVAVAGYQVFRNNNQIATTTSATFSDTTVSVGIQYTYAVSAFDAAGNISTQSALVTAATSSTLDTTPPSVPAGLQTSNIASTTVTVSWTPSSDNVAVVGYQIFRDGTRVATTTSPSYVDTGLAASTTYVYTVAAYDGSNNVSPQSQQLAVTTTSAVLTAPTFVQVNNNQKSSGASTSVNLNAPTLAGNTLVVYVIWNNAGSVVVTDSRGDTFVNVGVPVSWGNGYSAQIFYATNIAGGTDTVTAAFRTPVTSFGTVYVHEYTGISSINPVDVTTSASGSSAALNSGTATTTSANDLIFGAGVSDSVVTAAGSGFVSRDRAYGNITEDRSAGSIGAYAATATHSGQMWGMQMVAFRAAK